MGREGGDGEVAGVLEGPAEQATRLQWGNNNKNQKSVPGSRNGGVEVMEQHCHGLGLKKKTEHYLGMPLRGNIRDGRV